MSNTKARLDEDRTAKPLTEIVGVCARAEPDSWGRRHVSGPLGYVVRPTRERIERECRAVDVAREEALCYRTWYVYCQYFDWVLKYQLNCV
jgi:hypothetical protein